MSESMITRCPKCSTTFRVTQEVLNMAKGKVRCGQCFHIFTAKPAQTASENRPVAATSSNNAAQQPTPIKQETPKPTAEQDQLTQRESTPPEQPPEQNRSAQQAPATETIKDDGTVNPDWLDTLFNEEDLEPYTPPKNSSARFIGSPIDDELFDDLDQTTQSEAPQKPAPQMARQPQRPKTSRPQPEPTKKERTEELAPWEVELAELEAQFSEQSPESKPIFSEALTKAARTPDTPKSKPATTPLTKQYVSTPEAEEPDYMQALHSLAQDVSKHESMSHADYSSQESMKQLAAEYSLAALTGSEQEPSKRHRKRSKHTWLWTFASLIALIVLVTQIATGYFEQGSRSPEFRAFYKAACSYLGCTLPAFEDVNAVEIEHVRIQSHPTLANSLQVNAIMTNRSSFAQAMPKLALEFYDLNGRPVAARLFAPQNYLHKDFLDITFMPPNTPIHIVIQIQDPGARAVTHQIKVFADNTQSY